MQFFIQNSQVCHFGIFYHDMIPVYNFIIDNSVNYFYIVTKVNILIFQVNKDKFVCSLSFEIVMLVILASSIMTFHLFIFLSLIIWSTIYCKLRNTINQIVFKTRIPLYHTPKRLLACGSAGAAQVTRVYGQEQRGQD